MDGKRQKEDNTKTKKLPSPIIRIAAAVILIAVVAAVVLPAVSGKNNQREILVESTLKKIVNISQLSTFSSVYNGIAEVEDPENSEKIDYYVSYEAKVTAGIEFEQITFSVDSEKVIHVTLPAVKITGISVDITTMDYIFLDAKRNQSSVSEEAYKACEADVQEEVENHQAILMNAKHNAENVVQALIEPFIEQMDSEYTLEIDWEG